MGTRITPDDPIAGNPCEWFFDPDNTPHKIYAYFWELEQCPGRKLPPNMHIFTMFQDDEKPCEWRNVPSAQGWECGIAYRNVPPLSRLYLINLAAGLYFDGDLAWRADEHDVFNNKIVDCLGPNFAQKGNGLIFWLEAATGLLESLALPNDGNTFMEFFVTDEHKPVYKFCNVRWSLNQKYLINP